ncbi:hypothetical protein ACFSC3_08960 [Sphingomonas floccifaciens]|uniref:Uncharacterized protein n=1 Tax=Sphingomonas floccifaciens TaxID=1844115 RepID=A0ABW4ND21_9SPHN
MGDGIDHDLPWGWWLRAHGGKLQDEHGRLWLSVRDAFWQGRLCFPEVHFAPEQQELMLRTLSALRRRWLSGAENRHDLFNGDMMIWRFYMCWLASIGMLELTVGRSALEAPLSAEGRSVLLMLQATRDPEWERLPIDELLETVSYARSAEQDEKERRLVAFEKETSFRRHQFARERVGRSYVVTLTSVAVDARMPTRRVTWSQAFVDPNVRDALYEWLAERVDCWETWGGIAYRRGADAFNSHLLSLVIASGNFPA